MQRFFTNIAAKSAAIAAALALTLVGAGLPLDSLAVAHASPAPLTVTIDKYLDGVPATAAAANSAAFPMLESYTSNGTSATDVAYTLSPTGINSPNAYEAVATPLDASSTYTTNEDTTGAVVGATCSAGDPFALAGYTSGATAADAAAATPTLTPPTFTNLSSDEFVIVWNTSCPAATTSPTTLTATGITASDATLNGMNGASASSDSSFWVSTSTFSTASSAALPAGVYSTPSLGALAPNAAFSAQLSSVSGLPAITPNTTYYFAAWTNVNGTWSPGTVMQFTTASAPVPGAPTVSGISPSTGTIAGGTVVNITGTGFTGATAVDFGTTPATSFTVVNDTSITATSPAKTSPGRVTVSVTTPGGTSATSTADRFAYTSSAGTISGNVGDGTLAVTSITPVQTNATADGTYADGWSYLFNITVPTDEPNLSMSFANWLNAVASSTIPVGGNMQISSAQAADTAPVVLTAANAYSSPALDMVGDLSTSTPGIQVQVLVQVAVPVGTVNGSYTTSYNVQTLP